MNAKNFFVLVGFVICLFLPSVSSAQDVNWWDKNMLVVEGHGFPPINAGSIYQARNLSRRAAVADGYRALAEQVQEIRITAETTIKSQMLSGDIVTSEVSALIREAKILSEEFDAQGGCTVVMSVPIYGVTDSVAKFVFKPVAKKDFPLPSEKKIAEGNYTGLIIDCGGAEIKPVLSPVIRNENNISIYSYSNLDYDKVISRGVVDYAKDDTKPLSYTALIGRKFLLLTASGGEKNIARAGSNPLIIRATAMSDDNSCPVVSTSDADKILAENQASHFLDNGAVVFVGYRVGGLRA